MPKNVSKKISELFEPENGNPKYTKKYCSEHSGKYIVYTGTTIGIFGKIDKCDYKTPNLTFTTDGENAGTIEYIKDTGYCIGGHRTILKALDDNIDLLYFKYILQPYFYDKVKPGSVPSLHFNQIKDIVVDIPVDDNGNYDILYQKEMSKRYEDVENKKNILLEKTKILRETKVKIEDDESIKYTLVKFNEMFKLKRGRIISKVDIMKNKGKYPVFSTQREIYGYINSYMQDGKFLLWNTDGLGGYIKIANGKFSYTNIVGIMMPQSEKFDFSKVSLGYLKCILEPIFRSNRKGRMGINGKNEYTKLNSTMIQNLDIKIPIPIDDNGDFDLEKQENIMSKYESINNIKNGICKQIDTLINISIE